MWGSNLQPGFVPQELPLGTAAVEGCSSPLLPPGPTMASLWSSLERDVFNPQSKKLLETICVWKTGKKKKMSILCVVGKTPRVARRQVELQTQLNHPAMKYHFYYILHHICF